MPSTRSSATRTRTSPRRTASSTRAAHVPERWTFYIDKEGTIRYIDKGVQQRTETAGQDVVAKLKELGLTEG